jgi:hypothetical protein
MADIQPARISFNNENLDPDKARFTSYRLETNTIISLNHDLTYGSQGIPQYFYLLIVLNGGLYNGTDPLDDYIIIEDIMAGTSLDNIYEMVSEDITKPSFIFGGIYLDSGLTDEVTPFDRLDENRTIFIKWLAV